MIAQIYSNCRQQQSHEYFSILSWHVNKFDWDRFLPHVCGNEEQLRNLCLQNDCLQNLEQWISSTYMLSMDGSGTKVEAVVLSEYCTQYSAGFVLYASLDYSLNPVDIEKKIDGAHTYRRRTWKHERSLRITVRDWLAALKIAKKCDFGPKCVHFWPILSKINNFPYKCNSLFCVARY